MEDLEKVSRILDEEIDFYSRLSAQVGAKYGKNSSGCKQADRSRSTLVTLRGRLIAENLYISKKEN